MLRSKVLSIIVLPLAAACGTQAPVDTASTVQDHIDTPTDLIAAGDVLAVAGAVAAAIQTGNGEIATAAFLKLMPMQQGQRDVISAKFPAPMKLSCAAESRLCNAKVQGSPVSAQMSFSVSFLSNPMLDVGHTVATRIFLRSPTELEFCDVSGLKVRKFLISRAVDGLNVRVDGEAVKLIVDAGSASDNFGCE